MRQPADLGIAYCCVFGLVKVWVISILYTDQMADTIDAQIWSFAFVSWLFAHLSTENYLKALYLPWQKTGLGCGSRWKQACVATKDIVIMKAFEEPPVSNVPHWGRGKRHPLQPTPSQEHVRGYTLGEMTPQFKLSLQMQHKVSSWTEAAAFSVTTILYLSPMSPPDL